MPTPEPPTFPGPPQPAPAQAAVESDTADRLPAAASPGTLDPTAWQAGLPGLSESADAAQIGLATAATWIGIQTALAPIVGQRGMAALYKRSLHLGAQAWPWLAAAQGDDEPAPCDFTPLQTTLAAQSPASAAAGSLALLQTFHTLLQSLIGAGLTDRLLRPVWAPPLPTTTTINPP